MTVRHQPSFAGGELSPQLHSRIDLAKYQSGLKVGRNGYVLPQGGWENRPGTKRVHETKYSDKVSVLIPFQFNVEQSYILEFGDYYMRVHKDGGLVLNSGVAVSGATKASPCEVTAVDHGYSSGDNIYISVVLGMTELNGGPYEVLNKFAAPVAITGATQADPCEITTGAAHGYSTGDRAVIESVAGMVELNDIEYTITVTGPNTFTLDGIDSSAFTAYTSGGTVKKIDKDDFYLVGVNSTAFSTYISGGTCFRIFELETPYPEADVERIAFMQSADVMTLMHPSYRQKELSRTAHDAWSLTDPSYSPTVSAPTGVTATPGVPGFVDYKYVVTSVKRGTKEESLPSSVATASSVDFRNTTYQVAINLSWTADPEAESYNVYRKHGGVYSYIGSASDTDFRDDNIIPDATDTPPSDRDPFSSADDYPGCGTYHQQRAFFARSNNNPQQVEASQSGHYKGFKSSSPVKDDDAITFTIASLEVNEIRHLVSVGSGLVILTSGGEFLATGYEDAALAPTNIKLSPQSYNGCSYVRPVTIGNTILMVQQKGQIVRDLAYALESDGYSGNDLSVLSRHLFEGRAVKRWAYAKEPNSIVWAVMDDGSLLSLTYMREHEVWGWCRHDTDGYFESVATVSEGQEDAVYFIVKRKLDGSWVKMIERMESRYFDDVRDCYFVDCGITYDQAKDVEDITIASDVTITITGHGYSNGDLVELSDMTGAGELNLRTFVVSDSAANTFKIKDEEDLAYVDGAEVSAYDWGGKSRLKKQVIDGLDHLNGSVVSILADGNELEPRQVVDGAVDLLAPYARVHIGLAYESDMCTLGANFNGETVGRRKNVSSLVMQVHKTRGLFVGPDEDNLHEYKQRYDEPYGDPVEPMTGEIRLSVAGDWDSNGQVFVRQKAPLPVCVLSVSPEVEIGG